MKEQAPRASSRGLPFATLEWIMKPAKRRKSKGADAEPSGTVKTSLVIGRDLHSRWQAAASLTGMTANALAVEALTAAVRWVVIHDKR
jgi:hypothetical protein